MWNLNKAKLVETERGVVIRSRELGDEGMLLTRYRRADKDE